MRSSLSARRAPRWPKALAWAPPVLDASYIAWTPVPGTFGGQTLTAGGLDVLVHMPGSAVPNSPSSWPCIRINGAKNVIIQGGAMDVATSSGNEFNRDALIFSACTGILHVEGLQCGTSSTWMMDGINVYNSPLATLVVQNCEFVCRSATPTSGFTDGHPDGIFTDNVGGSPTGYTCGAIKIDRCRIDTNYQGLSFFGKGTTVYVQRTHVIIQEQGQLASTQGFWQVDNTSPVTLGPDVWLTKRASQTYGLSVHPDSSDATTARRPSVSGSNFITWPLEPTIIGGIQGGTPPVDMIPTDRGTSYVPRARVRFADQTLPYDATSPWNTPIGASPTINSLSATYMTAISDNALALTSDTSQYTIPIWIVDSSTPTYTVVGGGFFRQYTTNDATASTGSGSPWSIANVPVPTGAVASPGSDGQIVFWNPLTGEQWNFWQFASDIVQNPAAGHYYATNGNHCYTTPGNLGRFADGLSGRGAGTPYMAGLVRPWELAQGHIDHALAFGYHAPSGTFVYPASKSDGGSFGGVTGTDAPEGSRIQLDPAKTTADFNGISLNASAQIVAKALQDYGMYVIDNSGSSKVYLEADETATWPGTVTTSMLSAIPWSWFRVLA